MTAEHTPWGNRSISSDPVFTKGQQAHLWFSEPVKVHVQLLCTSPHHLLLAQRKCSQIFGFLYNLKAIWIEWTVSSHLRFSAPNLRDTLPKNHKINMIIKTLLRVADPNPLVGQTPSLGSSPFLSFKSKNPGTSLPASEPPAGKPDSG